VVEYGADIIAKYLINVMIPQSCITVNVGVLPGTSLMMERHHVIHVMITPTARSVVLMFVLAIKTTFPLMVKTLLNRVNHALLIHIVMLILLVATLQFAVVELSIIVIGTFVEITLNFLKVVVGP